MKTIIPMLAALLLCVSAFPQSKKEKEAALQEATKQRIDAKRFLFQAQSATPMKGGYRQLTPGYTFLVSPDTLISDLPYYGRAFSAPMNVSETGMKFTSLDFEYTVKNRKKGGWELTIKPRDVRNSPQVYFSISPNGTASLRISSNDRESISYSGYIEERRHSKQ